MPSAGRDQKKSSSRWDNPSSFVALKACCTMSLGLRVPGEFFFGPVLLGCEEGVNKDGFTVM